MPEIKLAGRRENVDCQIQPGFQLSGLAMKMGEGAGSAIHYVKQG